MCRRAALLVLSGASAAAAADPTMPLSEVGSGMRCTGLSLIRGAQPASFDVEVLDVVAGSAASLDPRILGQMSGPAVDQGA